MDATIARMATAAPTDTSNGHSNRILATRPIPWIFGTCCERVAGQYVSFAILMFSAFSLERHGLHYLAMPDSRLARLPIHGAAKSSLLNTRSGSSDVESIFMIIKPLGLPWETSDPFLFCMYHN